MPGQPLLIRRTVNPNPTLTAWDDTAPLKSGEPVVALAPSNVAKLWIGDGTANRLLLSTDVTESPAFTNGYLRLAGGSITGPIKTTVTTPTGADAGEWLVNKDYVDAAVASGQQRVGAYNAATNVPPLNPPTPTPSNGQFWDVNVTGNAIAGIPGISSSTPLNAGSKLVWNTSLPGFELIPGGGITQGEGDLRYVRLAGSTMEAGATITLTAPYAPTGLQVATADYVGTQLAGFLPLGGGSLAGPGSLTMAGALSVALTSTLTGNVTAHGAVLVGNPTGGIQAAGSINAQSIYLNGTALTLGVDGGSFAG